jgi:hypothetical protein
VSLFDGKIKTGTRIDLEGDDFSPNMGALVGSSYKEDVLNHGTLNQVVQGNVTRLFCVNETITVSANQTLTVGANRSATIGANDSLTVGANLTETVGAMVTQTYGGGQMTTCAGPHMRTDVSGSVWMCPAGTFINSGDLYECKLFSGAVYAICQQNVILYNISYTASSLELFLGKVGLGYMSYEATSLDFEANAAHGRTSGLNAEVNGLKSYMGGMKTDIRAVKLGVGASLASPPASVGGN